MSQTRKYYEEQLRFLREQGKAFGRNYPKLAPFLGEGDIDPDIERLLEGFAFVSGRLWQKLDDAYPELSEQLLEFIAPNYLKPLPSCSILEFTPLISPGNLNKTIKRCTKITTHKKGRHYFFNTCYDTHVLPMSIKNINVKREYEHLILRLDFAMLGAANLSQLPDTLRLYLASDLSSAYWWYYLLLQQLEDAAFYVDDQVIALQNLLVKPVGFAQEESLLPFGTENHQVSQLLSEYYHLPEKFMFVDIKNLPYQKAPYAQNFSLELRLKAPERLKLSVDVTSFRINCTPIMNIWEDYAAPITHDHSACRYLLNLSEPDTLAAVHSVLGLDAWSHRTRERYYYEAAYRCPYPDQNVNRYQVYLSEAVASQVPEVYIELWEAALAEYDKVTIAPRILAYQAEAFLELQQGEIIDNLQNLLGCSYKNITPLSTPVYPPLGRQISWHILCYLALAYKNLDELESLKTLLIQHDFAVFHGDRYAGVGQKLADSLHEFYQEPVLRFVLGEAIRGFKCVVSVREEAFLNMGELYLFGSLLHQIFSDRAPFNSFNELELKGIAANIILSWSAQL